MKYLVLFLLWFALFHKPTQAQILPPEEDQTCIANIFVSETGWVGNKKYLAIFCFNGAKDYPEHIYLKKQNGDLEKIEIPAEISKDNLTLVSSGPKYVCFEDESSKQWFYYFSGNRSGFLTTFAKKKMRGHDGNGDLE